MRIYLDCCCLQRPLDDQAHARIRVESEAVLAVLEAVQTSSDVSLLSSEALEYEIDRIPNAIRRKEVLYMLALADERIEVDEETIRLAEALEALGVKPMDAVHLAVASVTGADYFGTCVLATNRTVRFCSK
jgi:predicted nucleic acid-binding protein